MSVARKIMAFLFGKRLHPILTTQVEPAKPPHPELVQQLNEGREALMTNARLARLGASDLTIQFAREAAERLRGD